MEKLKINELEKFIEENKLKEMTIQDAIEDTTRVKHSILVKAEEQLGIAYEKRDSAMVAAIAEILKAI